MQIFAKKKLLVPTALVLLLVSALVSYLLINRLDADDDSHSSAQTTPGTIDDKATKVSQTESDANDAYIKGDFKEASLQFNEAHRGYSEAGDSLKAEQMRDMAAQSDAEYLRVTNDAQDTSNASAILQAVAD